VLPIGIIWGPEQPPEFIFDRRTLWSGLQRPPDIQYIFNQIDQVMDHENAQAAYMNSIEIRPIDFFEHGWPFVQQQLGASLKRGALMA
jgi:hypothetical protein